MSTRWKPEMREFYWYVYSLGYISRDIWLDAKDDMARIESGNCFKTREQAESALERIKRVLLESHDEN